MDTPHHDDAQTLLDELILPFYSVNRDMLVPTKNFTEENDAEHSWSLAILACALAEHIDENLDIGLIGQFSIVHDLVEVFAGDTSVWADEYDLTSKESREAASLELIKSKFHSFKWLVEIIEAYELQESDEAKYVKAMDKYIALCIRFRDQGLFYKKMKITKKRFIEQLAHNRIKAHSHPGVARYYERIRSEYDVHPEHFYVSKQA